MDQRKINRLTGLLLTLGLGGALAIFVLAPPEPPDDPLLNDPRGVRKYRRELAELGGKANQVSADFLEWFGGLWHGRELAGTVVVLTLAGTWVFRFVATPPPAPAPVPAAPKAPPDSPAA